MDWPYFGQSPYYLSASETHRSVFTNIIGVFKTEVVTREWGVAVTGLTMLLFGGIREP